jgi:hypothetical protein
MNTHNEVGINDMSVTSFNRGGPRSRNFVDKVVEDDVDAPSVQVLREPSSEAGRICRIHDLAVPVNNCDFLLLHRNMRTLLK